MGIVAGLAAAAAGASLAGSIGGMVSGGGGVGSTFGGASGAATYIPSGQPQADQLYQSLFGQMAPYANALPGQVIPGYQQYASNIQNNPYAGLQQYGANEASWMATGMWPGSMGSVSNMGTGGQAPSSGGQATPAVAPMRGTSAMSPTNQANLSSSMSESNAAAGGSGAVFTPADYATMMGYRGPQVGGQPLQAAGVGQGGGQGAAAPQAQGAPPQQGAPFAPSNNLGAFSGAGPTVPGGLAGEEFGSSGNMFRAGGAVLGTAFDPQNALYNQLQNQTAQQAAAANAASGVQGPAAAGVADTALQNLNIGWQNQQLGREATGIQSAGQAFGGGALLGQQAIGTELQGTGQPYNTYLGQQQNNINALNSLVSGTNAAFGPDQSLANLLQSYLGLGQSATGLAQAGQRQQFQQNQTLGNQFGQNLSGLGQGLSNLFGGSGGFSTPSSLGAVTTGDITGGGFSSGGY